MELTKNIFRTIVCLALGSAFTTHAAIVEVSNCEGLLTSSIRTSLFVKTALPERERSLGHIRHREGWLGIGSILGGVYVSTDSLSIQDYEGYRRETADSGGLWSVGDKQYRELVRGGVEKVVVLSGAGPDPVLIARSPALKLEGAKALEVDSKPVASLFSKGFKFSISPSGGTVAVSKLTSIHFIDSDSGKEIGSFRPNSPAFLDMVWLPDGKALVAIFEAQKISLQKIDPVSGQSTRLPLIASEHSTGARHQMSYLSAAGRIVLVLNNGETDQVIAFDPETGNGQSFTLPELVKGIEVSSDGRLLLIQCTNSVRIFDGADLARGGIIVSSWSGVLDATFNSQGEIFVAENDGKLSLWATPDHNHSMNDGAVQFK
ncbi:MAG: WD40 repeat domain-containing protein [Bdellovibrionales bacterium]|nr:WD40 repeat domain-containing protein [Bdellovibrionales bacterium]